MRKKTEYASRPESARVKDTIKKSYFAKPCSYGALAIGVMIGMGTLPANAAEQKSTNVYATTANPAANPAPVGNNKTSDTNITNQNGQQTMTNNTTQDGGRTTGATAGNNNPDNKVSLEGLDEVRGDVAEDAVGCANPNNPGSIAAVHKEELERRQELAMAQTNTDKVFNPPKEEINPQTGKVEATAVAGCFTAADEVVNLAELIPTLPTSWSSVAGTALRKAVEAKLLEAKNRLVERGCQVANSALSGALQPIHSYLSAANNFQAMQDPTGFLGAYISKQIDFGIDRAEGAFGDILGELESNIKAENQRAAQAANERAQELNKIDALINDVSKAYWEGNSSLNNSVGGAEQNILQKNAADANAELQKLIARKPDTTRGKFRERQACNAAGQCRRIGEAEYSRLNDEMSVWNQEYEATKMRAQLAAQRASGASTPVASSTYVPPTADEVARVEPQAKQGPSAALSSIAKIFGGGSQEAPAPKASEPAAQPQGQAAAPAPAPAQSNPSSAESKSNSYNPFS